MQISHSNCFFSMSKTSSEDFRLVVVVVVVDPSAGGCIVEAGEFVGASDVCEFISRKRLLMPDQFKRICAPLTRVDDDVFMRVSGASSNLGNVLEVLCSELGL